MTTPPDPFEELDRELRERVGGEFRRTAEEDEFTARKAALRKRDLAQVAYEMLSRGDMVRVTVGSSSVRGVLTHARGNLATLEAADGAAVHINLEGPIFIDVVERSTGGGRTREQFGPESFLARLRELELAGSDVDVLVGHGDSSPSGRIEAVGSDHLMIVAEHASFIPLAWIGAVRRR